MKLYAQIVVDLGDYCFDPDNQEERESFVDEVLYGPLILHSNVLEDELGPVRVDSFRLIRE